MSASFDNSHDLEPPGCCFGNYIAIVTTVHLIDMFVISYIEFAFDLGIIGTTYLLRHCRLTFCHGNHSDTSIVSKFQNLKLYHIWKGVSSE